MEAMLEQNPTTLTPASGIFHTNFNDHDLPKDINCDYDRFVVEEYCDYDKFIIKENENRLSKFSLPNNYNFSNSKL